jgi:hypothetical protein
LQVAAADVLPVPGDVTTLVAPDERGVMVLAHVRRVEGRNLWVWYAPRGSPLVIVALTAAPPSPINLKPASADAPCWYSGDVGAQTSCAPSASDPQWSWWLPSSQPWPGRSQG